MKILTINIWRYYEWEKRKEKVMRFLKEQNADIVLFQEAAYDENLKEIVKDQIDEINKELNYPGKSFFRMAQMMKWHEKPLDREMWYGLGILSKWKIKMSELILLPHVKKDKDFGFSHIVVDSGLGDFDIINVHFENTNEGSKEHLKFVLHWCNERNIKPVIAGDFNFIDTSDLSSLADKEYQLSYNLKPYKSFMPTIFSHTKEPITLDYILTHRKKFEMSNVECINNDVSDHKPVSAKIMLIKLT